MFAHGDLWQAIDLLAERCGSSTSGLALKAGLDATSLNKSKRMNSDGRERWPSTETLSKLLAAAETDLLAFAQLMNSLSEESDVPIGDREQVDGMEKTRAAA
ncbi:helix-turn-helix transcriptional regulator [Microvirga calopogonii]|uniref:helix-turn-helix transcriptional regulator n=1 Tax=Microvirga calopogonii TaxID=2078013 RepID=UPI000E0DE8C6